MPAGYACQLLTIGNDLTLRLVVSLSVCLSVFLSVIWNTFAYSYSTVKNWIWDFLRMIVSTEEDKWRQNTQYYRDLWITIDYKFNRCQREVMT